ncbi:N2227-domain-containing protein [Cladochytrium replicatum]|nr:N2227-domain-containing protein [Cladochytrium replicatum]
MVVPVDLLVGCGLTLKCEMFLNDPESVDPADRLLEQQHYEKVVRAFRNYYQHGLAQIQKRRNDFSDPKFVKAAQRQLLLAHTDFGRKLDAVEMRLKYNANLINQILADHVAPTQPGQSKKDDLPVTEGDMDKVRSTLRQLVRDWSEEGRPEREATYGPILRTLDQLFHDVPFEQRGSIQILVPGAGLGRLAYDIAKAGFTCQGNEFSFYMLFASNFILNKPKHSKQFEVYPWIHSFSNSRSARHHLMSSQIPDILPGNIPPTVDFSMVAGDFLEVYGDPENAGKWSVIVTCYFMDTAKNVLDYIETIKKALRPGGYWINIGPLLYHWEGMQNEPSIELNEDELRATILQYDFQFLEENHFVNTYTANQNSMLKYIYESWFFVAEKKVDGTMDMGQGPKTESGHAASSPHSGHSHDQFNGHEHSHDHSHDHAHDHSHGHSHSH